MNVAYRERLTLALADVGREDVTANDVGSAVTYVLQRMGQVRPWWKPREPEILGQFGGWWGLHETIAGHVVALLRADYESPLEAAFEASKILGRDIRAQYDEHTRPTMDLEIPGIEEWAPPPPPPEFDPEAMADERLQMLWDTATEKDREMMEAVAEGIALALAGPRVGLGADTFGARLRRMRTRL